MFYTYTASHGHTFEVVAIQRLMTPIASMVVIEALVFDASHREIAKTKWNQVPLTNRFYEHSTTFYPECRVSSSEYSSDNLEACSWLSGVFDASDTATYSLRAS